MRHLAIALMMLLVASCNWSDLDAEFLVGVPDLTKLKVRPPTQMDGTQTQALQSSGLGNQQSALQSATAKNLENGATSLNALIDNLAAGLDFIRQVTPSKRETDKRTWGPYPDSGHPGFDIEVVMTHDLAGYTYSLSWSVTGKNDFVAVITGTFTGEEASSPEGSGSFTLDYTGARAKFGDSFFSTGDDATLNTMTLSYDHGTSGSEDVRVWMTASYSDKPDASYQHLRHKDGGGTMSYFAQFPPPSPTIEAKIHVDAEAIWLADRSGHFKETVTWGIYGPVVNEECWDKDLTETVLNDQFADQVNCLSTPCPNFGDPTTCVPFEPAK
jgi:hypothetical protein